MKKLKILLLSMFFSIGVAHAKMFEIEEYKKIEESFINYAIENNDSVYTFYINNYLNITDAEKKYLRNKINKELPYQIKDLIKIMLDGRANNSRQVINYTNSITAWVMSEELKGQSFIDNQCAYLRFISTNEDCLAVESLIKNNIKEVLIYNDIKIDEEYFSDFFYIHELSHLIPQQRKMPEDIDITKIWVNNHLMHYREIYSDLFAIIYMNNILGYNESSINNVVLFRNFNLNSNDDLLHYSVPYIKAMLKNEKWKNLKTFESIDSFIIDIYKDVNKNTTISKKSFKHIQSQNFQWCNNLNFSPFKVREALDKVVYHCKKLKNK